MRDDWLRCGYGPDGSIQSWQNGATGQRLNLPLGIHPADYVQGSGGYVSTPTYSNGTYGMTITANTPFDPRAVAREVGDQLRSTPSRTKIKENSMSKNPQRLGVGAASVTPDVAVRDTQLLATNAVKVQGGTVGQVLVFGQVVWQSTPFDELTAEGNGTTAEDQALDAARAQLALVLTGLFAPATPSGTVGFQATS